MHYVILRDDDTSALTPPACLERLYRPFLDRGLPVNLAVIPEVRTDALRPNGRSEGFLPSGFCPAPGTRPLADGPELLKYLKSNPGYHFAQHGCFHDCFEFDQLDRATAVQLLEQGAQRLREAGLPEARTFVAPHDRISRAALAEIARRFAVISTGWFELGRLPRTWVPRYLGKKLRRQVHWRVPGTALLSHPGCLLSCTRAPAAIPESVRRLVESQTLTVLVTHWWEYFREGASDEPFINALHGTADYLAAAPDVRVVTFADVANGDVPLK